MLTGSADRTTAVRKNSRTEAELFGAEAGAYTGATKLRDGLIREAVLTLPRPEPRSRGKSSSATPRAPQADRSESTVTADREQVEAALQHARGVVAKAAAELGMSRQALHRRMERLGMSVERRLVES